MPKLLIPTAAAAALVISACAWAQAGTTGMTDVCQQKVDHVLVEQGNISPPIIVMPDVGAFGETPQQEWNYVGRSKDAMRVHCFPHAGKNGLFIKPIPAGSTRCVLADGSMMCGA